jgi:hypothetical protein
MCRVWVGSSELQPGNEARPLMWDAGEITATHLTGDLRLSVCGFIIPTGYMFGSLQVFAGLRIDLLS